MEKGMVAIFCPSLIRSDTGATGFHVPPRLFVSTISERLQVFDQILTLLRRKPQVETRVVAVDYIPQSLKTPVMVKAAFILWLHEESAFADVKPRQVHRPVCAIGRAVCLEAVDLHLGRRVVVQARPSPNWRLVATGAVRFAAEKGFATSCGSHVEAHTGSGFWRRKRHLIIVQRRQLGSDLVVVQIID